MIRIHAKTITGKSLLLGTPIALSYDADRYIPCDSFSCTCELQDERDEFCEVKVTLDESHLFEGIVDRQKISLSNKGRLITLECRSKTAVMLDNEIRPCYYFQLTSDQLFATYAKPFGIASMDFPFSAKKNYIQIKKGSSAFTLIYEFCRFVYHKLPYITRENVITLSPLNQRLHLISNSQKSGLSYADLSIHQCNDKVISKLYMKTATQSYGDYYGASFENENAKMRHIKREKYYHPTDTVTHYKEDEARQILKDSNRDSFWIEVTLPYIKNLDIGDCVKLLDGKISYDNLYISKMTYKISPTAGCITTLLLRDRQYA